jgi:hypothetical protein
MYNIKKKEVYQCLSVYSGGAVALISWTLFDVNMRPVSNDSVCLLCYFFSIRFQNSNGKAHTYAHEG